MPYGEAHRLIGPDGDDAEQGLYSPMGIPPSLQRYNGRVNGQALFPNGTPPRWSRRDTRPNRHSCIRLFGSMRSLLCLTMGRAALTLLFVMFLCLAFCTTKYPVFLLTPELEPDPNGSAKGPAKGPAADNLIFKVSSTQSHANKDTYPRLFL